MATQGDALGWDGGAPLALLNVREADSLGEWQIEKQKQILRCAQDDKS
jgi:hypothetical protein